MGRGNRKQNNIKASASLRSLFEKKPKLIQGFKDFELGDDYLVEDLVIAYEKNDYSKGCLRTLQFLETRIHSAPLITKTQYNKTLVDRLIKTQGLFHLDILKTSNFFTDQQINYLRDNLQDYYYKSLGVSGNDEENKYYKTKLNCLLGTAQLYNDLSTIKKLDTSQYDKGLSEGIKQVIKLSQKTFDTGITELQNQTKDYSQYKTYVEVCDDMVWSCRAMRAFTNKESLQRNIDWSTKYGEKHRAALPIKSARPGIVILAEDNDSNRFNLGIHYMIEDGFSEISPKHLETRESGYSPLVYHELIHSCQSIDRHDRTKKYMQQALERGLLEGATETYTQAKLASLDSTIDVREMHAYRNLVQVTKILIEDEKDLKEYVLAEDMVGWLATNRFKGSDKEKVIKFLNESIKESEMYNYDIMPEKLELKTRLLKNRIIKFEKEILGTETISL